MKNMKEWKCTDQDALQYMIQTGKRSYTLRQFDDINYPNAKMILDKLEIDNQKTRIIKELWETPVFWVQAEINLDEYTKAEKEDAAASYGYEFLEDVEDSVLAECLFELQIHEFIP